MMYMLIFKLGACVACFMAALSIAVLLTLLIFSKPYWWSNHMNVNMFFDHDKHMMLHSKNDLLGKGAVVAAMVVFGIMVALPLSVLGNLHGNESFHAEIIKFIVRALS